MNVDDYYVKRYGEPCREARYISQNEDIIYIYKWGPEKTNEGVTIYATMGVSQILKTDKLACEFFIGIEPEIDGIVEALAETGIEGNGTRFPPNSGDTLTLSMPLWEGALVKTFMFSNGAGILPPIACGEYKINFIKLVPLFEDEILYKVKYGEDGLWKYFEKNNVPYWSSERTTSMK